MNFRTKGIARRAGRELSWLSRGSCVLAIIITLSSSTLAQSGGANSVSSPPAARSSATVAASTNAAQLRQETLDVVWRTVNETHYDPTFGGVDWDKVRAKYAPRVAAAKSDGEFYGLLRQMVEELRLSHFVIYPPGAFDRADANSAAGSGDVGIDVRVIEGQAIVVRVRPQSAAGRNGVIRPGFIISKIDDTPVAPLLEKLMRSGDSSQPKTFYTTAAVMRRLNGTPGSTVRLTYIDEQERERTVTLQRAAHTGEMSPPFGNFPSLPVEFEVKRLQGGVGYIRFNIFLVPLMEQIRAGVREMRDVPGLIFDLRGNPGGFGAMAPGIAGLLTTKEVSLGTMRMRTGHVNLVAFPQSAPYTGTVVILIDGLSLSTSEIFASGMQEAGRAVVIGERSGGAALPSVFKKLPTGALLQHAIADFKTPKGTEIEGRGATPDIEVKWNRRALLEGRDAQLDAALEQITKGKGRTQ
ncbi:MAG TPA: S41 family peptidase [Pyrinomonadaceae bacterium]|nr:S41 family peptidase [Pyrinomonadaceae bacterium]